MEISYCAVLLITNARIAAYHNINSTFFYFIKQLFENGAQIIVSTIVAVDDITDIFPTLIRVLRSQVRHKGVLNLFLRVIV